MNFHDQSAPPQNPNFRRFWGRRDHFFGAYSPADLDREADRLLADGNRALAEVLSFRAAAMREGAR